MLAKHQLDYQSHSKNNSKIEQSILFKTPSKKLVNFVLVFRIGIAIAALFSLLVAGGCSSGLNWSQDNTSTVNQAISENTFLSSPEEIALVRTTLLDKEQDLVLVDYRSRQVCGLQGCLYNIYLKGKKIWSKYVQPDLPPKTDLFALSRHKTQNLPCLDINQYDLNTKTSQSSTYCFDGQTYSENKSLS